MANELTKIITPQNVQAHKYIALAREQMVITGADFDHATAFLKDVVKFQKGVESIQKERIEPLKEQMKEIKEKFAPTLELLDNVQGVVREKINAYLEEDRKRREKALAELNAQKMKDAEKELKKLDREEKKAEKYDDVTAGALRASIEERREDIIENATKTETINQSSENATVRMVWVFDVEDANSIPREYLILDEKKVREAIRDGSREIPGLKIYQKPQVAIK